MQNNDNIQDHSRGGGGVGGGITQMIEFDNLSISYQPLGK